MLSGDLRSGRGIVLLSRLDPTGYDAEIADGDSHKNGARLRNVSDVKRMEEQKIHVVVSHGQ